MNILMMTNTYSPIVGGLEKSIAAFSKGLRKIGHKVLVAAPQFKDAKKNEAGVLRVPAIQNFNGTDFSVSLPIPEVISQEIKNFKPDLVHAHHPFLMGDMALRIAGQSRLPLVFTYHTLFDQYENYFPLNTELGKNFISEMAIGYANLADQVIAPSESIRDILIKRGVETPVFIVPTGLDVKRFETGDGEKIRKSLKIPAKAFLIGHAGRISTEKNLDFLGRAISDFLKKNQDSHCLIVGRGPFLKNLRRIFLVRQVLDRVHLVGVLRGQRLVDAYHAMDVFTFSSQSETQGLVLTEAMAAGIPVIALDAPGVREVVRDKKNGRLFAENTSFYTFAGGLRWFKKQPAQRRQKMKKEATATALELSMEKSLQKICIVYEQAKAQKNLLKRLDHSRWRAVMGRIKTEWNMLTNFGKAAGSAILEEAAPV